MLHPAAFNFGSMRRLRVNHSEFCSEGFTDSVGGGLHYNDSFHAMPLGAKCSEQTTLSLGEFHRRRACSIVICDVIDSTAYGIGPH